MKQVLQDLKTGAVVVTETPEPEPARGRVLVRVQASLLSAGTESAMVAKGRQSLLEKIRDKPELLSQGLHELRERGLSGVQERLASKFEGYAELGYSCAGVVVDSGSETGRLVPGTLVACAGAGAANHAEFVSVPMLLTAVAPAGVEAEAAAYATVGAIAMQGVRQAQAQIGEYVVVIGLGLVGLLVAQLLRTAGCRVAGIDPSPRARERGLGLGCDLAVRPEEAGDAVLTLSGGMGADAVIICAATPENSPVELAGKIARSRARVVMVGATGMTIPREEYYRKELTFSLSRSYGPGRYDTQYEEGGYDYPVDYVRFTEQRNMRSFLELVQRAQVDTSRLTTHRFPIEQAPAAYALLNDPSVDRAGILLEYKQSPAVPERFSIQLTPPRAASESALGTAFIGAGTYAQSILLPLLKRRADVALRAVVTRNGGHALHAAKRFGFERSSTRIEEVLEDPAVRLVFIATRHDSHARLTCQALAAGKDVWVEKPLALSLQELKEVYAALKKSPAGRMVVGFNRPFSPSAQWLASQLGVSSANEASRGADQARMMTYRVNAGYLPADSWVHDPQQGGGRLLGEGCHFLDFLRSFAGAVGESVHTEPLGGERVDLPATGNFAVTVRFSNGSVGQVLYSSQGAPAMGKERFECFLGQKCGAIEDYKSASVYEGTRREDGPKHRQDKGQAAMLEAFIRSLGENRAASVRPEDFLESSLLTLAAQQSLVSRQTVALTDLRKLLA